MAADYEHHTVTSASPLEGDEVEKSNTVPFRMFVMLGELYVFHTFKFASVWTFAMTGASTS